MFERSLWNSITHWKHRCKYKLEIMVLIFRWNMKELTMNST